MIPEKQAAPKRMDIKEFREFGYLQELNRQFLHPLGLALEVVADDETGEFRLGGIFDCRDDPEGMIFGMGHIDPKKAARVQVAWHQKEEARIKKLGYIIQPVE
ncbi:MAG: hypothetical protein KJ077_08495 [Anaerolineae bacterium]|nr:hypothetical protein [Anaerolineae bacterium]